MLPVFAHAVLVAVRHAFAPAVGPVHDSVSQLQTAVHAWKQCLPSGQQHPQKAVSVRDIDYENGTQTRMVANVLVIVPSPLQVTSVTYSMVAVFR